MDNKKGYWFFLVLMFSVTIAQGQSTPILEKIISIDFNQEQEHNVLTGISSLAGCTFSYNSTLLNSSNLISGSYQRKSVRFILEDVFKGRFEYKARGAYVIITKNLKQQADTNDPLLIRGYVIDENGIGLSNASVYYKNSFASAISNQFGLFKLTIDKPASNNQVYVSKDKYRDTTFVAQVGKESFYTIQLRTKDAPIESVVVDIKADSLVSQPDTTNLVYREEQLSEAQLNMRNISDTLYRKFQVSFVPFVGSNHKLSGNVINDYSFNVLGGHSLGTKKLEFGGLFNINRGDAANVQVAGLFNNNGGDFSGVQLAGIINRNENFDGPAQVAGVVNWNRSFTYGLQLGGVVNVNSITSSGVQIGGTVNLNLQSFKGIQIGGTINVNGKSSNSKQIAGVANIQADSLSGFQIAGVLNVTTKKLKGVQVAGVINYAKRIEGAQVGLINISDTLTGVPVGLISYVNKGYHKVELSADEISYTNIAIRTGVHRFYNILTAGIKPGDTENFWTFGYGIGTAPKLSRKLYMNVDLIANHASRGHFTEAINLINKLYLGVEWQAKPKVSFTGGLTLNGYVTKTSFTEYPELFTDYTPHIFVDETYGNNLNMKMWLGFKAGVRFF